MFANCLKKRINEQQYEVGNTVCEFSRTNPIELLWVMCAVPEHLVYRWCESACAKEPLNSRSLYV